MLVVVIEEVAVKTVATINKQTTEIDSIDGMTTTIIDIEIHQMRTMDEVLVETLVTLIENASMIK
ncbi:hypothetical protein D3C80_1665910 [compost metagenome]